MTQVKNISKRPHYAPAEPLTSADKETLTHVESSLQKGLELYRWWKKADETMAFAQTFSLTQVLNRPEKGYSFFADADLSGSVMKVIGDVPDMFYDRPKAGMSPENWRDQLREFVLAYFMRISAFQLPEPEMTDNHGPQNVPFEFLSLFPKDDPQKMGFGFRQLYFKPMDGGPVQRFAQQDQMAVIDVRELFDTYEWVVANIEIYGFDLRLPGDPNKPGFELPLVGESVMVILHRDFVTQEEKPGTTEASYGFGYATLLAPKKGFLAYGPGAFEAGFQVFYFNMEGDGEIHARMPFCVNRPEGLVNLPVNPLAWGLLAADALTKGKAGPLLQPMSKLLDLLPFGKATISPTFPAMALLNLFTGGQAARDYGISRDEMQKLLLIKHYGQYFTMLTGSLLTWRQIEDWSKPADIPLWAQRGLDVNLKTSGQPE